jgi:DMSO/TMAO reductase YedYZ molybdopterin-dependent catalytic subunit
MRERTAARDGRAPTRAGRLLLAIPAPSDFRSRLRGPEVTARIGLWLGVSFGIAFVTGVISHLAQDTPGWLAFPTRPVSLYRVTQALHVVSGTVAVPLLVVKLWTVYPKLFARPDLRSVRAAAVHALERLSIAVLVSAAIFELASGLANSAQWYPWAFHFRATHYAVGWVAIGALLVHVAVKLPIVRSALAAPVDADPQRPEEPAGVTRRGLLRATWVAAAAAALTTAGAAVPPLRRVSVFAVRSGDGPGDVPINHTASQVRAVVRATDPSYRLTVVRGARSVSLSRTDLEALPQHEYALPIACVEGWSASGVWRGPRLRDLLAMVGAPDDVDVEVTSLQETSYLRVSVLPSQFARDPLTLLALELNGDTLSLDHGYPCRLIAPDRPGVLQTKWVGRIEALA